jgi:hypothetical protein
MLAALMLVTGCATKATGDGWIFSATDPTQRATFGLSWDATDCANPMATSRVVRFNGSYHDPAGSLSSLPNGTTISVRLKGAGKLVRVPPPNIPGVGDNCTNDPTAPYDSQEAAFPGSGTLDLTLCDFGQGHNTVEPGDFIIIRVNTGPYTGYQNTQQVQGGNIQASA